MWLGRKSNISSEYFPKYIYIAFAREFHDNTFRLGKTS